jgi:hypothetical protein
MLISRCAVSSFYATFAMMRSSRAIASSRLRNCATSASQLVRAGGRAVRLPKTVFAGRVYPSAGIVTLPRDERERIIDYKGTGFHAAATTSHHVLIAAARSTRCD